jgi:hypothetical protein
MTGALLRVRVRVCVVCAQQAGARRRFGAGSGMRPPL